MMEENGKDLYSTTPEGKPEDSAASPEPVEATPAQPQTEESPQYSNDAPAQPQAEAPPQYPYDAPAQPQGDASQYPYGEPVQQQGDAPQYPYAPPVEVAMQPMNFSPQPEKKKNKKLGLILGIAGGVLAVVLILVFVFVIQPIITYNQAEQAFADGDLNEAERLLDKIPDYKDTPDLSMQIVFARAENYFEKGKLDDAEELLLTIPEYDDTQDLLDDITYERAVLAVGEMDYETAQDYLDSIPGHEDPEQLKENICYNQALQILETGDYVTAYNMLMTILAYQDSEALANQLYNEALALSCILDYREMLKDPSSMQIYSLEFFEDDDASVLIVYMEVGATNSYGAMVTSYVLYSDFEYIASVSDLHPTLYSWSNTDDYLNYISAAAINGFAESDRGFGEFDLDRINHLLTAGVTFNIDFDFSGGPVGA